MLHANSSHVLRPNLGGSFSILHSVGFFFFFGQNSWFGKFNSQTPRSPNVYNYDINDELPLACIYLRQLNLQRTKMSLNSRKHGAYTEIKKIKENVLFFSKAFNEICWNKVRRGLIAVSPPVLRVLSCHIMSKPITVITFGSWVRWVGYGDYFLFCYFV